MNRIIVASTGLLVACGQTPDAGAQQGQVRQFVESDFVIITQSERAVAIYTGQRRTPRAAWLESAGGRAMERATGCPLRPDSLQAHGQKVAGRLDCARANSLFRRARAAGRGRSARAGAGRPPDSMLLAGPVTSQ